MPVTNFGARLQNIARASGYRIRDFAVDSIAADVSKNYETDAAASALARELREIRKSRPLCFEPLEAIEESQS
jgi:hypothetical protein